MLQVVRGVGGDKQHAHAERESKEGGEKEECGEGSLNVSDALASAVHRVLAT